MEKRFANRIKTFLTAGSASARGKHYTISQEIQEELVEDIESLLQQAYAIGQQHGQAMLPVERAIALGGTRNLLDHAKSIVAGIIDHVRETINKALANSDGREDNLSQADIVDETMGDLIESMPELIAESETVGVIEGAVKDTLKDGGAKKMQWLCEPDACELCQHLADSDPVGVDAGEFEGGVTPPLHLRCRCQIGIADK